MIHRTWSLLTGPATLFGGIVATVAVANFILVKNDPFIKPDQKKYENQSASKNCSITIPSTEPLAILKVIRCCRSEENGCLVTRFHKEV
ncbi:hypothetical protein Ahy_A02g009746 [Arachis hypogaea]|uniref:Uncharacterized protein n=1 Tax=Arachis hypogaea TaxID=3818 RepID=A0A445EHY0_ARAHY|nr:hypothetical protein Ahy_A02g009746 [Arachis hypogaea]